ncbi:hypothetical protein P0082_07880 [Candidatus Haliotispira prima]|uniref:Uncharacterized protein n=1 Tax=Candidatus Haliotispira prima TaxID=3034016 RepID=A0ABY8MGE6_9SPIO|nr:hypothetical protein P0082_07880 [Candidatus Haliotispira prima]
MIPSETIIEGATLVNNVVALYLKLSLLPVFTTVDNPIFLR